MKSIRRAVLPLAFAGVSLGLLLPLTSTDCAADVVHLRTGESVKGRPLPGRTNEKVLVIEDFLNGSIRTLDWTVVDPEDRRRLQEGMGIINKALKQIVGHRIVIQLNTGKDTLRGLVVREDGEFYYLLQGGKELEVRKSMVVTKEDEPMDPRDVWSPEQLVERYLEEFEKEVKEDGRSLDELNSREKFRIGEYAEKAGDFETAKKHYSEAGADEAFLLAHVAKQRLERVEAILKDAAALDELREMRLALSLKNFRRVREMVATFKERHPDAGEGIQHRLESGKKDFVQRRAAYFQLEAKINLPKILLRLIKDKVQEKDVELSEVQGWTKRELVDAAFEELTAQFKQRDDVEVAEARSFWEGRPKRNWKTATYGSGTFIVEKPKIKPPKRRRGKKKSGSSSGKTTTFKPPKPPNENQWWADAKSSIRVSFIMAFVAEQSGLFEVSPNPIRSKCPKCNGEGLESKKFQTGTIVYYLCTRCGGAQTDKRVKFR